MVFLNNDVEQTPCSVGQGELSIFLFNSRSMHDKVGQIQSVSYETDIIFITETQSEHNIKHDDILYAAYHKEPFR